MALNNLSHDGEFRYVVQWFCEWSELQREDFVPILVDYLKKNSKNVYMNGVVTGLANSGCDDKPMSLFQCRIKLFKEWSPKWPEDMQVKLKEKIIEIDPKIGEKVLEELESITSGQGTTNGNQLEPSEIENGQHILSTDENLSLENPNESVQPIA